MASSANQFSLFLLLLITLLSSSLHTHARDSQLFNKVTTNNVNNVVPNNNKQPQINQQEEEEHEPNFLPENENGYGLYGHESAQLPPSTTTTTTTTIPYNKHLPKNYNPVAYVTEPENINDNNEFTEEKSFATNPTNYYNNGEQEETEFKSYRPTTTTSATRNNRIGNNNNFYYNGGSSFNSRPSDTRYRGGATIKNGGDVIGFQTQGMSDTRFLENGKYFYDVNSERYSNNHPYESLKGVRARNEYGNRNYYANSENGYELNSGNSDVGGYQNADEFLDVDENNLP